MVQKEGVLKHPVLREVLLGEFWGGVFVTPFLSPSYSPYRSKKSVDFIRDVY